MGRIVLSRSDLGRRSRQRSAWLKLGSTIWDLMSALGRIAVAVTLFALVMIAVREYRPIAERLGKALPRPIADFFHPASNPRPPADSDAELRSSVLRSLSQALEPTDTKARASKGQKRFGLASTKEDVLAIQGKPSRMTDTTWTYSESEVYFASDRVVGWRNSTRNPLNVR